VTAPDAELIIARWIAPVEPDNVVLENHGIVLAGDRILAIGPAERLIQDWPHARRTVLPNHLLTPGFVNLHTHAAMALLRGTGDDLALERWLRERIWPLEARLLSEQFVFDGSVLACAEMLRSGITCFNDMYFFPESTVQAAQLFGMRVAVAMVVLNFPTPWASGPDEYLRKGLDVRDRLRDTARVHFTLGPHAPYTVSDPTLREIAKLSAELSLPIHIHVQETATEVAESLARHGRRPLVRLAELGILGPETIAVHAVHLDAADIALLKQYGVHVAHCPHSNLKLASGIAPVAALNAAGVPVGIGTDGSASNNRLDLLAEARTAALLVKGTSGDATLWPAHQTLRAMTLTGAKALGLEAEIGSLTVGKCADIVAFDLDDPALLPVTDPVAHLIYAAGREHVSDVWLAGRPVVQKRQLLDPTTNRVLHEVAGRAGLWQTPK
jgi:5-methylthioadenosine/S-adenosylhomocysteine deaminase